MTEDELLLTHVLRCRPADLLLNKPALTPSQKIQLEGYKSRRRNGEPLQYILGSWDFCGLEFKVDPRVLVPRPETEMLVDLAVKRTKGGRILDLGTGSGNIAVTMAKFLPDAHLTAVDLSEAALSLAQENARTHKVEGRIEFVRADMTAFAGRGEPYDLIISNPPYIPSAQMAQLPADVRREPAMALEAGTDGLDFIRSIINRSTHLLRKGGYLMMEFGDGQAGAVLGLAESQFKDNEIHKDLTGRERIFCGKVRD